MLENEYQTNAERSMLQARGAHRYMSSGMNQTQWVWPSFDSTASGYSANQVAILGSTPITFDLGKLTLAPVEE